MGHVGRQHFDGGHSAPLSKKNIQFVSLGEMSFVLGCKSIIQVFQYKQSYEKLLTLSETFHGSEFSLHL